MENFLATEIVIVIDFRLYTFKMRDVMMSRSSLAMAEIYFTNPDVFVHFQPQAASNITSPFLEEGGKDRLNARYQLASYIHKLLRAHLRYAPANGFIPQILTPVFSFERNQLCVDIIIDTFFHQELSLDIEETAFLFLTYGSFHNITEGMYLKGNTITSTDLKENGTKEYVFACNVFNAMVKFVASMAEKGYFLPHGPIRSRNKRPRENVYTCEEFFDFFLSKNNLAMKTIEKKTRRARITVLWKAFLYAYVMGPSREQHSWRNNIYYYPNED